MEKQIVQLKIKRFAVKGDDELKKLNFEESINKLEEIVKKLECGEESLESSLKLFEEGSKLSVNCYKTLKNAEQKVSTLSQKEIEFEK